MYAKSLRLTCTNVLHEGLFVSILMMAVRHWYGERTIDIGLRVHRWITLVVFFCIREIEYRMHGLGSCVRWTRINESILRWFEHIEKDGQG